MCVDSLVKQKQFYVILDSVIVVLLLTFIELFVWTYLYRCELWNISR